MKKVLVMMGSDSDLPQLLPCLETLKQFAVPFQAEVCSAHRSPEKARRLAEQAEADGFALIICAAGMAAHLAGVIAAHTVLPVLGIPMASGALNGVDALYATVMMPPGIPVATLGINGAKNAALLAVQILALSDPALHQALVAYKAKLATEVDAKNERLQAKLAEL